MHPSIQSALDAASQGNKNEAIGLIRQALSINPNDLDALLTLATLVEEPTLKRKALNRVLSLEPINKPAREMLLDMDRAEMGAYRSQPISAPVSKAHSRSAFESDAAPQHAAAVTSQDRPPSKPLSEKPLVFRPSSVWLVLSYLFATVFCCAGFLAASQSVASSLPSFGLALLFGLTALSSTSKVEVRETGIRASALFGGTEMKWNEISDIKSNSFKRKLALISNTGKSVNISTQVKGYPVLIEILRQKRPDLFTEATSSPVQENRSSTAIEQSQSPEASISGSAPQLTGIKTFQKSFLKQYGIFLWITPVCLLMAWFGVTVTESQLRLASFLSVAFCALVMIFPFFQVNAIKVEPNKLTIETFFQEKELSADQIKEIKMQSLQGRYGRVTNIVNIIPVEGKNYPLGGFSDGDEIIYGYLMNWWNTYQVK